MKVSVLVTLFNDEEIIDRLVDFNILNLEKLNDIEVLFIDDHSSDRTLEKLHKKLIGINIKYKVIKNKANFGVATSRNIGIRNASGKYIAILDSDDLWHVNKIEIQRNILEFANVDVIATECFYSSWDEIDYTKLKYEVSCNYKSVSLYKAFFRAPFVTPSVLIRKSILEKDYFPDSMRYAEDYHLWLRLIYKYRVIKLNCKLVNVVQDEKSILDRGLSDNLKEMHKGVLASLGTFLSPEYPIKIRFLCILGLIFENLKYPYRIFKNNFRLIMLRIKHSKI